jgi:hypothetical protein
MSTGQTCTERSLAATFAHKFADPRARSTGAATRTCTAGFLATTVVFTFDSMVAQKRGVAL